MFNSLHKILQLQGDSENYFIIFLKSCHCREPDGQASGGDDSGNDDWIFNTIREKDLKKCQNGTAQPYELKRKPVRRQQDENKFYVS